MASKPRRVRLVLSVLQTSASGFGREISLFDRLPPDEETDGSGAAYAPEELSEAAFFDAVGGSGDAPLDFEDAILRRMEEEEDFSGSSDGTYELTTTAEYTEEDGRCIFTYAESELTGMEGTVTQLSFSRGSPGVISLLRSGTVKSAFILEEGRRHTSVYETPLLPFEVCVYSRSVKNAVILPPEREDAVLHTDDPSGGIGERRVDDLPHGEISFDYVVEIRGMDAQRTRINIKIG